ncbi:hypothetical protein C8F04DRAFT_1196950 [Mycena alexandri]|uniref:Uncharacterized protein n=1 Tax=Mycena alexandri TaxID=1745969 RepID=A0AAD6WMT8_9AGAR|nr:hypothetical protein C8F04DRAFT_1196950 [Mycena alexandri]
MPCFDGILAEYWRKKREPNIGANIGGILAQAFLAPILSHILAHGSRQFIIIFSLCYNKGARSSTVTTVSILAASLINSHISEAQGHAQTLRERSGSRRTANCVHPAPTSHWTHVQSPVRHERRQQKRHKGGREGRTGMGTGVTGLNRGGSMGTPQGTLHARMRKPGATCWTLLPDAAISNIASSDEVGVKLWRAMWD